MNLESLVVDQRTLIISQLLYYSGLVETNERENSGSQDMMKCRSQFRWERRFTRAFSRIHKTAIMVSAHLHNHHRHDYPIDIHDPLTRESRTRSLCWCSRAIFARESKRDEKRENETRNGLKSKSAEEKRDS